MPEPGAQQRLKGRFTRPVFTLAALGAAQQTERRRDEGLSDTYEESLGREGGTGPSPIQAPSYAAKGGEESDVEKTKALRQKEADMRAMQASLVGPEEVEFVEEGAAPARQVSGVEPATEEAEEAEEIAIEESEVEFAEDLASQQAQAAQTERIAREQSRLQALKRASQQAEAIQKNLQQTKRIWRSVNAANAAHGSVDIGGLLLTLATMNVQFINKYFFKTPLIPETSFPYEDGIVVAADLIIIIFTMLVLAIVIGAIGIIPAIISNLPGFLKSALTGSP